MIIRIQDSLANLILGVPPEDTPLVDRDDSRVATWDGKRLILSPGLPENNLDSLLPLVPDWMREMVVDGTTLFVDPIEFANLDYELKEYIDIIQY